MKKYILSALCALVLIACAKSDEDMVAVPATAPETIYASFEEPTTRTYVEQDKYLRWHAEDEISFFSTTYNLQYRFQGNTGDNNGSFTKITTDLVTGNALANNYAVYPYVASTAISDEGVISVTLPATQAYAENSFGRGANTMVAATNGTMDNVLRFKNAGGYLKLQLYGTDVTVKSVALQGNKGEKIAGEATITAAYGNDPVVTMADTATEVVTIDCGEGVTLSNDATIPTIFWFVLPETTFAEGFTVTVTDTEGGTFVKSTSNSFTIDRNMIQPMKSLEAVIEPAGPANNEIWYTATSKLVPYNTSAFNAQIVENIYDVRTKTGILRFDEKLTSIGTEAFFNCNELISITLPNSVEVIGKYAFRACMFMQTVYLSNNLQTIGTMAFGMCENLISISLPASLQSIGSQLFSQCNKLVQIISNYSSPDYRCFIVDGVLNSFAPAGITEYILPEGIESISPMVFMGYKNITSLTIPSSLKSIGSSAFSKCSNLSHFAGYHTSADGKCIIINNSLLAYAPAAGKTYAIPSSAVLVAKSAFADCTLLEELVFPDNVIEIEDKACAGCINLNSVILGNKMSTIGAQAFYNCPSITEITLPTSVNAIGNFAFSACSNLVNVKCLSSVPPTLGTSVFSNNSSARNIYVPSESLEAYRTAANWSSYADSIQAMQ